jgi:hypothetical protein
MASRDQPRDDGWTVVLRRQPARIMNGRPHGSYTDALAGQAGSRGCTMARRGVWISGALVSFIPLG